MERYEVVENICKKYLSLKKRKDTQEILLRGSIETLQVEIIEKEKQVLNKTHLRENCL